MPISPHTVGFSFGSFGDIITVLQLAWELRAALDESAGASAELRALMHDVDAFTRALQEIQANIERRRKTLRPDVVNGIAAALSRCRNVLSAIQQRIERARGQTSTSGWHKYWGTAAWSILGGKKDVEALRARLSEQLGIIQLYLSLSEANSQEHLQDVLVKQDTTLQRIYTVVQDIQIRFDVGVPGFHFYNSETERFYPPFARTSLQRLRDVYAKLRDPDDCGDIDAYLTKYVVIANVDFEHRREFSAPLTLCLDCDTCEELTGYKIECLFFREAAFGEWQVRVGTHSLPESQRNHVKILLERGHTVGVDCNCVTLCSTRYRGEVEALVQRHEVSRLYTEAMAMIIQRLQPDIPDTGLLENTMLRFLLWPDLNELRLRVLPTLRQQRLSLEDMVSLLSETPLASDRPDFVTGMSGEDAVCFPVHGGALVPLLVGHDVPVPGNQDYLVRLPSWGYLDCLKIRKKIVESETTCSAVVDAHVINT